MSDHKTRSAQEIGRIVVEGALKVHSALGPGLLESAYETCLAHELLKQGCEVATQVALPVQYDGIKLDAGYRIDMRVDGKVIVEVKAVERILPVHHAQIISYLRLSGIGLGLLINFNVKHLKDGLKRFVQGDSWR